MYFPVIIDNANNLLGSIMTQVDRSVVFLQNNFLMSDHVSSFTYLLNKRIFV